MRLTVATWNLNGRRDADAQVDAICKHLPHVVTLQEVTRHSWPSLESALIRTGLANIVSSVGEASDGPRKYGLVIASRLPLQRYLLEPDAPWRERVLVARLNCERDVAILTTHIPPASSNGPEVKSSMLEAAIIAARKCAESLPTLITGDFNAPQSEHHCQTMTWGQYRNKKGEIVVRRTPLMVRQHLAELAWFTGEFTDAYRSLHPEDEAFSWILKRSTGNIPRRFDHVFLSPPLMPLSAHYDVNMLTSGLSDHAPLIVTVALA